MRSELLYAASLALALTACTWETDLPADVRAIEVRPERELLVTDDDVLATVGNNTRHAPLSFAAVTAKLDLDVPSLLRAWSARLPAERARVLDTVTYESPETAPFRLAAVVNRTDLTDQPDRAAPGGEGRLVFALTQGPADDPASPALPLAVIFEWAQRGTSREWVSRWHTLATAEDLPTALTIVTSQFVTADTLAQVRTADAFTGPLRMEELHYDASAHSLVPAKLRNTIDWARIPEADVRAFVAESQPALEHGTIVFPEAWWSTSSSVDDAPPSWAATLPRGDAFVNATCTGCHARSPSGFHVDPKGRARTKLSPFLRDEALSNAHDDELARRTVFVQLTLSGRGGDT